MSSERGNCAKSGGQKHRNAKAYRNDMHNCSKTTKALNALQITGCCFRCKEVIQWKIKFSKYKILTQPKKCVKCSQKSVKNSYYTICQKCIESSNICGKCGAELPEEKEEETTADREVNSATDCHKNVTGSKKEEEESEDSESDESENDDKGRTVKGRRLKSRVVSFKLPKKTSNASEDDNEEASSSSSLDEEDRDADAEESEHSENELDFVENKEKESETEHKKDTEKRTDEKDDLNETDEEEEDEDDEEEEDDGEAASEDEEVKDTKHRTN